MVSKPSIALPAVGNLSHGHRIASTNPDVHRALSKLTRTALLDIVLQWLAAENIQHCAPFLDADEKRNGVDDAEHLYLAAYDVQELREYYEELKMVKGSKREIVDRILDGDWRHGLSLYQFALLETAHLLEHQTAQRWHALRLIKINDGENDESMEDSASKTVPHIHHPTFLNNLQRQIGSITRAHYYVQHVAEHELSILRVQMFDMPYNTSRALQTKTSKSRSRSELSKSLYIAFPGASPFVYVSFDAASVAAQAAVTQARSLQSIVIDAIPRALSRPQERYALKTTRLAAKSLAALLALRSAGRSNCAAGGWSIFADDQKFRNVLQVEARTNVGQKKDLSIDNKENVPSGVKRKSCAADSMDERKAKRSRQIAQGRFGNTGHEDDGKGIERLEIRIDDTFRTARRFQKSGPTTRRHEEDNSHEIDLPDEDAREDLSSGNKGVGKSGRRKRPSILDEPEQTLRDESDGQKDGWRPDVRLSFQGSHVFAGLRRMVECGIVDGERMPGWMTGEAGVSIGVVREGRILMKARDAL